MSGNVSKHVTVMSELSRLIDVGNLMDASQLEQQLVCSDKHSECVTQLQTLLAANSTVPLQHKIRLVMLYALRYEDKGSANLDEFLELLRASGADQQQIRSINDILEYAGSKNRSSDIFSNKDFFTAVRTKVKREVKGVSNVYTQHKPYLDTLLDQLGKNKLNPNTYPFLVPQTAPPVKSTDVIVFFVGGATYEEALCVDQFNKQTPSVGVRVILGGTTIHNSKSFMAGIKTALGVSDVS
jgi:vacuolar protein sorting-associated protein 45